ncbi:hypothetical protein HPG69_013765 [Diceros bicornis minor]|uniref:Uncharacterized protein n=1 Tax=Diceros bicornis minor TaxID=77932 RepID=A0A7J7FEM3_DICBM|nr:hypothetical protein HPG69_013765 [Diceros bicornis minor]
MALKSGGGNTANKQPATKAAGDSAPSAGGDLVQKPGLGLRSALSAVGISWEQSGAYLVGSFKDTNLCATHSKCITITPKGVLLAYCICGERAEILYERKHFIFK